MVVLVNQAYEFANIIYKQYCLFYNISCRLSLVA
jgi:hypothetical protein